MQAQRPSGLKRKSSTSRTARIRTDSPKRRRTESSQETDHESPSNVTCSQRENQISSEADTNQTDPRVESSCPVSYKRDQINDKTSEEPTRNAAECVLFHDPESKRLQQVIATHRKEVVQHGNISELFSHLIQEGLLDHDESEYLQSGASNGEKMSRVLDSLEEKPNGFTKFLTCIKREINHLGHAYIASLLEERQFAPDSDLQLSALCKQRIKHNMVTLVKNIDLPSLVPHLSQSFYLPCIGGRTRLLTHYETDKLLLGRETTQNKISRLFFILETKGPLAHSQFARCISVAEDHKTHQELFEEVFEDLNFPPDLILPSSNSEDEVKSEKSTHKIEQLIASNCKEVVQHSNISELSSHLVQEGLLDHGESEYLLSEVSNEKKMSCVLNSLKGKPNGFTKFLKCVKRETNHMGHPYVASLLEERQFAPDPELKLSALCKQRIKDNMVTLVKNISLSFLVPHLHQSFYLPCIRGRTQLLTLDETDKLLLGRETTQNKIRRLFFILETKGPLAHSQFARCMSAAEDHKTHRELFENIFKDLDFPPDQILPSLSSEDEVESDTVCISHKSRKRKSSRSHTQSQDRKFSKSQTTATTEIDSPIKQRHIKPSPQKTICQVPNDIACSQQIDQTPNTDPLVESSCPVPSGANTDPLVESSYPVPNTDQIESKASEKFTHKIEQLIASHRKEVIQHGNVFELSSHLVQEGLLDHDKSEYLQSEVSNEKKMSCVLNSLKEKPNGFMKFLQCVKRETNHMGHPYVASLLEERQFAPDPELKLSAECKKRIQNNVERLVEGISLSGLVPHLQQSFYLPCIQATTHLLTDDETKKLLFESETTQHKVRLLFSILESKGPLAHSRFARCMYAAEDHKTHRELFEEVFENLNFSPDPILPWLNEEPASQSSKHKNGCLAADDKLLPFVLTNKTHLLEMDGVIRGNCYDELMEKFYFMHHNSDGHQQLVAEAEKAMVQDDLPLELKALYRIELAHSFIFRTQNEKAVELLSAVLKLSEKILGNNGLFIIGRCHHTFADLYRFTNNYNRAKQHSTRALMALHSVKPGLDTATAHYVNGCILLEECLSNQHSMTPIDIRIIEKSFHSAINDGKDSDIARRVTLPQSHCRLAQLYMSSAVGAISNEDNLKKARQSLDACKCQLGFISQISQHLYYLVEADRYRNSEDSSEAVRLVKEAIRIAENINYTLGISSAKAKLSSLT